SGERQRARRAYTRVRAGRGRCESQRLGVHEGLSTMTRTHWLLAMLLLWFAPLAQSLAADDGLADRIAACTGERDDARRLACFDRAAAPQAAPQAELAKSGGDDAKADQQFGLPGSELARNRDDERGAPHESTPDRITASVAELSKRPRGELVFTLD